MDGGKKCAVWLKGLFVLAVGIGFEVGLVCLFIFGCGEGLVRLRFGMGYYCWFAS